MKPEVKAKMEERDEAMAYQCVQMFDCDGDRREFARKQWADFLERGGPARKQQPAAVAAAAAAVPQASQAAEASPQ